MNKCILHFHGGGFVAMDSASHQSYTRQWANKLKVPIFSIDYRLAPAYPFPAGINDCYQAYVWVVTQSEEQLCMKFDQIIFAGDSAGGHLCYAVAYLALLRGFRPPDGILAAYPCVQTDLNLSPSGLLTIDDWLLNENFMNAVLMSLHRNGGNPSVNPLASPLYAPNRLIAMLPSIVMLCCEGDSLRDGAF